MEKLGFFSAIHFPIHRLLLIFFVITMAVSIAIYAILVESQNKLIEQEALTSAEIVATQVLSARSTFTSRVVDKLQHEGFGISEDFMQHPGYVPIPAQYLRFVGEDISKQSKGLFHFSLLSKWNLFPSQGLSDDFQRWAWVQFEKQDLVDPRGPIDWTPRWRFEQIDGVRTLRYMKADPAAEMTCVECHNKKEQELATRERREYSGQGVIKKWKQHQLLGAIEVQIPIDRMEKVAAGQYQVLLRVILVSLIGLIVAAFFAIRDLRHQHAAAGRFKEQSRIDALTGLGNRLYFHEQGNRIFERATRMQGEIVVLFIDLDGFKPINDTHGHQTGDFVLKEVARRLASSLREGDILARCGGDEFLVMLWGAEQSSKYAAVAEKILSILMQPIQADGQSMHIGASIGVSCSWDGVTDLTSLVNQADAAMYQAKQAGGNCYRVWQVSNETTIGDIGSSI